MDYYLFCALIVIQLSLTSSKPLVDPGVYVLQGVSSCRNGSGYCVLSTDCTIDSDFMDDNLGGHCDGLARSFTEDVPFVCCMESKLSPTEEPYFTTLSSATMKEEDFELLDANPIHVEETPSTTPPYNEMPIDISMIEINYQKEKSSLTKETKEKTQEKSTQIENSKVDTDQGSSDESLKPELPDTKENNQVKSEQVQDTQHSAEHMSTHAEDNLKKTASDIQSKNEDTNPKIKEKKYTINNEISEMDLPLIQVNPDIPIILLDFNEDITTDEPKTTSLPTATTPTSTTTTTTEGTTAILEIPTTKMTTSTTESSPSNNEAVVEDSITDSKAQENEILQDYAENEVESDLRTDVLLKNDEPDISLEGRDASQVNETETESDQDLQSNQPTTVATNTEEKDTSSITPELDVENEIEPQVTTTKAPMKEEETTTGKPQISKLEGVSTTEIIAVATTESSNDISSSENETEITTHLPTLLPSQQVPEQPDYTVPYPINIDKCGIKHAIPQRRFRSSNGMLTEVASVYEYCWSAAIMVKLHRSKELVCNGALIERDLVITTASCIKSLNTNRLYKYRIVLGDSNLKDDAPYTLQYHDILEVASHPDYLTSRGTYSSDVGLIRLRTLATLSENVCLICVPQDGSEIPEENCSATGYKTEFNDRERRRSAVRAFRSESEMMEGVLLRTPVDILKKQECKSSLIRMSENPLVIQKPEEFICDENSDPLENCRNTLSRGSPLTCEYKGRWYLTGLTSWSKDCVTDPNVYTKISSHSGWILTTRIRFYGFITHLFDL